MLKNIRDYIKLKLCAMGFAGKRGNLTFYNKPYSQRYHP